MPLDQDANYNPRGMPSRSCAHCYAQFKEWRARATGKPLAIDTPKANFGGHAFGYNYSQNADYSQSRLSSPTTPVNTSPPGPSGFGLPTHPHPDVAHSVPRDWNWSTF